MRRVRVARARQVPALVALLLAGCTIVAGPAQAPHKVKDVITPQAAGSLAFDYAKKRNDNLSQSDQQVLRTGETQPVLDMDLAAQASVQSGFETFQPLDPTSVDAYVPHQSNYPATFLALVHRKDGSGLLLGFIAYNSASWQAAVVGGVDSGTQIKLTVDADGFVPAPRPASVGADPITSSIAAYMNVRCQNTAGCRLNPRSPLTSAFVTTAVAAPVSGAGLDREVDGVVQAINAYYKPSQFSVVWDVVGAPVKFGFPRYHLMPGGTLGFTALMEEFQLQVHGGCMSISRTGESIDGLLEPGQYTSVTVETEDLLAFAVPDGQGPGDITDLAGFQQVVNNVTSRC